MSDWEQDPEVLADLQLRAASERDRGRSRVTSAEIGCWRPSGTVTRWPCRAPKCGVLVEVSTEGVDALELRNRMLVARGEKPLSTDAVMLCDEHRRVLGQHAADAARRRVDRVQQLVLALKASPKPRQEHDLIRKLTLDHHPDVPGLLDALERRLESEKGKPGNGSKRTKRGDL